MADSSKLVPFILSKEGGYVNDKDDSGGATNFGITLATWRKVGYDKNGDGVINKEDIKLLTEDDFHRVFKRNYWDACKADLINDQSVANMLVDFAYNSGVARVSKFIQKIVCVTADGIIGSKTIQAINNYPRGQRQLFATLRQRRINYLNGIVIANPTQKKFYNGWMNRVNAIGYGTLTYKGKEHGV